MGKVAKTQTTTQRVTYIQNHFLARGFSLQDFRDLVAATEDYDKNSRVTFEQNGNVLKVTEVKSTPWTSKGREEESE